MIKTIIFLIMVIPFEIKAQTVSGFSGCGEYVLKGLLVKSNRTQDLSLVVYKVNSKTKSEMTFAVSEVDDQIKMSSYFNTLTEINARISKKMNGTIGEINQISKVSLRRGNPLEPLEDTGIFLISSESCKL